MKKTTIIFGSPRKNSNTHLLVEQTLKGLQDSGTSSEIFYLNEMDIKGCQACYYCKKSISDAKNIKNDTKICAVADDMQKIYTAINESQGLIVASPIYFGGVTGQTKIWLDRLFPYINMQASSIMPQRKKASFIFTQNQPDANLFQNHVQSFEFMLQLIGFDLKEELIAVDLDKGLKPMVTEDETILKKAYEIGKNLLAE